MKCYFQGGPPDEHHFLLNVPKVTVGIFISSSPGTSRAGGNPNSLSINLLHAVLFPYQLIPPSLLTDEYFIAWTRDEHSPVSFTPPGRSSRSQRHWSSTRWERWAWKLLAIELFYEVGILCFDVLFQVVRMADYLSRSHPPFSPSSLSSHSPQRSTCRCLTYKHRIRHYILKCCSIFHSTLILLSTLYILVIWYYGFQCRWLPFVLSMSSLFDVVAAMTPGSWNMT